MKRKVKFGTMLRHEIIIEEFNSFTGNVDIDFYTEGEHVAGWCLGQDAVDELIQKLMQVKRKANKSQNILDEFGQNILEVMSHV